MTVVPQQVIRAAAGGEPDDVFLGVPGAVGRWQPTRAGAVNSWAWADETLLFADGWLALAGPNGSGKSLTASMLVTLLLDANSAPKALSVSGEAAGTLADRHTNRNPREDRTGAWWLEYGRRSADTDDAVDYLTTGLWLRSVGGDLHRAYFQAPVRVGAELRLQADRDPVAIEDLAEQLATCGGQLFTDSQRLARAAGQHLVVGKEDGYKTEIRSALFAPLDEVQFDALVGVLRSLRSVRTAEAISPNEMRRVLTDALPALDPSRLAVIAEAMERITDLEQQLNRSREEARLLDKTESAYRRYVGALTRAEAAGLLNAVTRLDDQTRKTRLAETARVAANSKVEAANTRRKTLREELTKLEGRLAAADAELRDHAGADLPHLERRLDDLRRQQEREATRAGKLRQAADRASEQATAAARDAHAAQRHLTDLSTQLQAAGTRIGADAFLERLLQAATILTEATPDAQREIQVATGQLISTPLGWTELRAGQIQQVDEALRKHAGAQEHELAVASELRRAEAEEYRREEAAELATGARRDVEQRLRTNLADWDANRVQLPELPPALTSDTVDRIDPHALTRWLDTAVQATRQRIDVPGHQQAVAAATAVERAAATAREKAAAAQEKADASAQAAAEALQRAETSAEQDRAAARAARADAAAVHEQAAMAAHQITATAQATLDAGVAQATRVAARWAEEVGQWRAGLVHLPKDALALPVEADLIDLHAAALTLERAYAATTTALQVKITDADRVVREAEGAVASVADDLAAAQQAAPVPVAPPWRPPRNDDAGAPLWSLVDFAPHVSALQADRLEGALLVAGLLDALVTRDGAIRAGDVVITADAPVDGRSLADLLVVDTDPSVPAERVMALLRAVGVDTQGSEISNGRLHSGVLTALAPPDYRAAYIGRTARERARLANVATLQKRLDEAEAALEAARQTRAILDENLAETAAERDRFPATDGVHHARDQVAELHLALQRAQRQTTEHLAAAHLALQQRLADIAATETATAARLADAQRHAADTAAAGEQCQASTKQADGELDTARQQLAAAAEGLRQAEHAQQQADAECTRFPDLEPLRTAQHSEDLAAHDLGNAQAATREATARHKAASNEASAALRGLTTAATLPDGTSLPVVSDALHTLREAVGSLARQVQTWQHAADRTADLLRAWRTSAEAAATARSEAEAGDAEAETARLNAERLQAQVDEVRKLHGTAYEQLRTARDTLSEQLHCLRDEEDQLLQQREQASNDATRAQATLDELAPQRRQAEQERDRCLRRMGLLVTHQFALPPEDLPTEPDGRPANVTAAITWARRILAEETSGHRLDALIEARGRALTALETAVRTANHALAAFDQQVDIATLDGTDWRRVTLAATNAAVGEDLLQAVATLRATTARLEADLREDVKATLKTSMFTQLRRDIQDRRELARDLVRQIRATLAGVRTGVERVGVEVDWTVRHDPDAQQMIELLTAPPSDETFNQMYEVLRQRLDDANAEAWADRVGHTFDYRSWHEWNISITHRSFSSDGSEVFRPVTARSNPLKSLSTGESRLATMLPLLAAAWSMYSGDSYQGPRLLSVDEIDAAFDEPNLRQVFALLRGWNFDVLATTPTMTPMIKREVQQVVVHQLVTAGRNRVTVPWLWRGRGEPQPLTFEFMPAPEAQGR